MTTSGYGSFSAPAAGNSVEERRDPHDGHWYTFKEVQKFYRPPPWSYSHEEVMDFWENECEPAGGRPRTTTDIEDEIDEKEDLILSLKRAMSADKKASQRELDQLMKDRAAEKQKLLQEKDKVVLSKLKQVEKLVEVAVNRFTSSPIFPFTWKKFLILNLATYATVWVAGRDPADFWKWHLLNYVVLFPIQVYRWYKCQNIALMIEFCWVANFCITIWLAANFIFPSVLQATINGICYRSLFAFAFGPFAFALLSTGNALVPHSINHQAQLLIHLQPLITAYELKYGATIQPIDHPVFPSNEEVGFLQYVAPPLIFVLLHQCLHSAFFLTSGIHWPPEWQTTFTAVFTRSSEGLGMYARMFGTIGDGRSERLRSLKLDATVTSAIVLLILPTYLFYSFKNGIPTLCVLLLCILRTFYEGAVWYETKIDNVNAAIDRMIAQEQGNQV